MAMFSLCVLLTVALKAVALPADPSAPEAALITPPPTLSHPSRTLRERGIISDLTSEAAGVANSIVSDFGTAIPSYVQDGLLPGFVGLPTGAAAMSSAGVKSSDLNAQPTQVLQIPGYGNWTEIGWNLRLHGNVFKQPVISNQTVDKLANKFLIGTSIQQLPPAQSAQAANLTREIFVVQQSNSSVSVNISPGQSAGSDGEPQGGGGINPPGGGNQTITLPDITTPEGDFDSFVQLQNISGSLLAGNGTLPAQRVQLYTEGTLTGNATSYLVSQKGMTIVSDIDDILRITKIYEPKEGILNTFAKPFIPWRNMPDIYRNWSQSLPDMHFHYLTTTPEQITRNYMQFIYDTYPGGSFDTRPLNFSDLSATLSIRKYLLVKIFETFPQRKFVLIADTSNSDVMRDYPEMATLFPGQVQCIFLRNTSSTDPGDRFPYNTQGFKGLNQSMYMFFNVPDDLTNLDIANGQCYNHSIKQNVTFGYQGLPFGLSSGSGNAGSVLRPDMFWSGAVGLAVVLAGLFGLGIM